MALNEIRRQQPIERTVPIAPFAQLVRQIADEVRNSGNSPEANADAFLRRLFSDATMLAFASRR
jgi:histone H3/H4